MEQNTPKFRLRLNLFDGIVLVLALAVGAFLAWNALKPAAPAAEGAADTSSTVTYTVRFQRLSEGTGALIQPGDALTDVVKNYAMGTVTAVEIVPAESRQLDTLGRRYVLSTLAGYEDALVTVQAPCTSSDADVTTSGGYAVRVGATAYVKGSGYMGSGPIVSIEREGLQ